MTGPSRWHPSYGLHIITPHPWLPPYSTSQPFLLSAPHVPSVLAILHTSSMVPSSSLCQLRLARGVDPCCVNPLQLTPCCIPPGYNINLDGAWIVWDPR